MDRTPQIMPSGTLAPTHLRGHMMLQNVSFFYPNSGNSLVLKGVSLELLPGRVTALVGPSGSGKSTVVALLQRFYEPQQGRVLLDHLELSDYDHHFLHRKVVVVSQNPVLFARSLHANIVYGLEEQSQEKVVQASQRAGVDRFISRMNHGYDTDAGEAGGQISGGQKQGIALARALIRDPRVLVLDDATSALDTESQQQLEEEIYNGAARRTRSVLLISHRLRSVERADRILVMEDGEICEEGTYEELVQKKGLYWQLLQKQQNGAEGGSNGILNGNSRHQEKLNQLRGVGRMRKSRGPRILPSIELSCMAKACSSHSQMRQTSPVPEDGGESARPPGKLARLGSGVLLAGLSRGPFARPRRGAREGEAPGRRQAPPSLALRRGGRGGEGAPGCLRTALRRPGRDSAASSGGRGRVPAFRAREPQTAVPPGIQVRARGPGERWRGGRAQGLAFEKRDEVHLSICKVLSHLAHLAASFGLLPRRAHQIPEDRGEGRRAYRRKEDGWIQVGRTDTSNLLHQYSEAKERDRQVATAATPKAERGRPLAVTVEEEEEEEEGDGKREFPSEIESTSAALGILTPRSQRQRSFVGERSRPGRKEALRSRRTKRSRSEGLSRPQQEARLLIAVSKMLVPAVFQAAPLILCDRILLSSLDGWCPFLAPLGVPAAWLEAALRLLVLWGLRGLLSVGRSSLMPSSTVAAVSILPPLYLLVGHWLGNPPLLLSSAPWSWWLVSYGAVGFSHFLWGILVEGRSPEESQREDKATLGKLLSLFCPDKLYLAGAFLFLILAVIGETFLPYYIGCLIDILGTKYDPEAFSAAIFRLCLVSFLSSAFASCRGGLFTFIISRMIIRTRNLLFSSLVRQDLAFFQEVKTGVLASRLSEDIVKMSESVPLNANIFLRSLIKAVGLYGFMLGLSWHLTLLVLVETPFKMAIQKVYDARRKALLKAIQDSMACSKEVVREAVFSVEMVRSFATEQKESQRYEASLEEICRLRNQRDLETAVHLIIIRLFRLSLTLILLYCGYQQICAGLMTKGNLVSFILYHADAEQYVENVIRMYGDVLSNVGAAEKVFEYLDREPSIRTEGMLSPEFLQGRISFQNVSFCYPSRPNIQVLKNVSFELCPGKVTALVGLNGSGKSSCVNLLEHFYEPPSGEVLLDGVPVREYGHKYFHRQVALVGQEPVLFSGSVWENITYGLQGCSEEDVRRAAEEADALGFIRELEGGFVADVGENGELLSVGQKQRLAIARALIRNPKVLVLDEATSALDPNSEAAIQQSIRNGQGRTVLVIAHRMQTVENADKIVVLEGGEVVEEGTHAKLMGQRGPYYSLVERTPVE
ncbi:antigen peptide transporter 2-like [Candoia aspera]|uniref:antigen peptide transporter 2-like n=1 Tax=Candoia aspera TaxID=51853 RepID=UPI002FD7C45D